MNWWQILIVVIATIIFFYLAFAIIIVFLANSKLFLKRGYDPDNDLYIKYEDCPDLNRSEYYTYYKKAKINGFIYTSNLYKEEYKGFIILSHGLWGSHIQYLLDIEFLTSLGYKVLAFDNYGVGLSEGENQISLANSIYVLNQVIDDVKKRNINENLDLLLYGHSMGGYAVSCALKKHQEIKSAIIRSAPLSASVAGRDLLMLNNKTLAYFLYPVITLSTKLLLGRRNDESSKKMILKNKKTSILIFHAKNDQIVFYKHSLAYKLLRCKKDNIKIYINEKGRHNSILTEKSQDNYSLLKKEYKELLKENDNQKIHSFISNVKENKRMYYSLNDEVTSKIKDFLKK